MTRSNSTSPTLPAPNQWQSPTLPPHPGQEWAYAETYYSDEARAATYLDWLHHYNHHRAHTGIGGLTTCSQLHKQLHLAERTLDTGCRESIEKLDDCRPLVRCKTTNDMKPLGMLLSNGLACCGLGFCRDL